MRGPSAGGGVVSPRAGGRGERGVGDRAWARGSAGASLAGGVGVGASGGDREVGDVRGACVCLSVCGVCKAQRG